MNRLTLLPTGQTLKAADRMLSPVNEDYELEQLHRYAIAADLGRNKDVLDIACGEGYGAMLLASSSRTVIAVDNSREVIDNARQRYQTPNLHFETGVCQEIPLPAASVDLVVSFETISHILEAELFMAEVRRVLRPGGVLLMSCPNEAFERGLQSERTILHLRNFSQPDLENLVSSTFRYHFWLAQRVCYGSIAHGVNDSFTHGMHSYAGDFQQVQAQQHFVPPVFLLLCSDAPLPAMPNSVFENAAELGRLRSLAPSIEAPLLHRVKNLELRISRMECSTWWRLRKPLKFLSDLILDRPATGMFTPPKIRPSDKNPLLPHRSGQKEVPSEVWKNGLLASSAAPVLEEVTVIIPAYNNFEELQFCLASILRYTSFKHRIFIVDDCSTDVRVGPMLRRLASQHPQISLHRNTIHRGRTATLNSAIARFGQGDLAIVNSNVAVSKKWLHKLAQCSLRDPKVATVSPLTNRAGPFDVPFKAQNGGLPAFFNVMDIAETVERCATKVYPAVPAVNPSCFYLRRAVLDQIGGFDEKNFPHGFGEHLDFAARASEAGFIHLIEDSTFVFEKHAPGLKEHRLQLSSLGQEKLASLHPQVSGKIEAWLRTDPLHKLRHAVYEKITDRTFRLSKIHRKETRQRRREAVLYVLHEGNGGTVLTSEDLIKSVSASRPCYLLRTSFQQWSFYLCENGELHLLQRFDFARPWSIDSDLDEERSAALDQLLQQFTFRVVHIRHLLGSAPEIIHRIKQHGVPVVFSFHDFYTVCPTIQLLDDEKKFCAGHCTRTPNDTLAPADPAAGGANDTACADCSIPAIWPLVTLTQPLKHKYVHEWRKRTRQALEKCDGFVTTSKFSTQILIQHFDFLRKKDLRTIDHGRDFANFHPISTPPTSARIRIVYFGSLQVSKGSELLAQIMRLDRAGKKRFEFHLLGSIGRNGFDPRRLGAIYHGRYGRDQLAHLIGKIKPSFTIIPSIWPETFCHTLTESWALGLPVFASDIGTLSERVRGQGGGWLANPHAPQEWYETMLRVSNDLAEYQRKTDEIRQHPLKTIRQMSEEYSDLYDSVTRSYARAQG